MHQLKDLKEFKIYKGFLIYELISLKKCKLPKTKQETIFFHHTITEERAKKMIKGEVECAVCNNIVFDCVGISILYKNY